MSFLDDYLAEFAPDDANQGHLVPPMLREDLKISVSKLTGYLPVPDELLMDCGVIPDTRPRPVLSRRERFARWRRRKTESARMTVAKRAYRLIGGEDVPEPEDW